MFPYIIMDKTDEQIIEILVKDGRISFVDMAKKLGLTEGAIRSRVKKLIKDRVIEKFTIEIKNAINAVVMVGDAQSVPTSKVAQAIRELGVDKVYEISGSYDIICFVHAKDIASLNDTIEKIRAIKGVVDTTTSMVLK